MTSATAKLIHTTVKHAVKNGEHNMNNEWRFYDGRRFTQYYYWNNNR